MAIRKEYKTLKSERYTNFFFFNFCKCKQMQKK